MLCLGSNIAKMERCFSIEAKSFYFSFKEGFSLFRLEERRKNFCGYIFVSINGSSWLIDTVEEACKVKEDIAKSFREGDKTLMVHGGANKAERFLEVAMFAEGGHKGAVWILEGQDGRGWRRFAGELRLMLAYPESYSKEPVIRSSPSLKPSPTKIAEDGATAEGSKVRSFTEVLLSISRPELEGRSRSEVKTGGVRIDEDYERSIRAAGSAWKRRGSVVKD